MVTIRLAKLDDSEGVVTTVKSVYEEYGFTWEADGYHSDLYDLKGYCDPNKARFWVAEVDGEIVGCGGLEFFDLVDAPTGEICLLDDYERIGGTDCGIVRMYVRPTSRRMGIATGIMKRIVDAAQHRAGIEIWSDKRFVDAHRLYESFGARTVGERICRDPDQAPEWGMVIGR